MAERQEKKRTGRVRLIILIVLAVLALTGTVTAKYLETHSVQNIFSAKYFYFTSNLLMPTQENYVLNATTESISFTLNNFADALNFSDDEITYTVAVKATGHGGAEPVLSPAEGTIANGQTNTVTVTLSNLKQGATYTVTAVGRAGYKQTLKAQFTIGTGDENIYKHLADHDEYLLLTVWTENLKGNVTISCGKEGLIPDNTDPVMADMMNYSDGTYKALAAGDPDYRVKDGTSFTNTYSSRVYRFFRSDPAAVYDVDNDFTVTLQKGDKTHTASTEDIG